MKKWLLNISVLLILFASLGSVAHADDLFEEETIEPNQYKKRTIQINRNFRNTLINKEDLPEEQLELTFEGPDRTDSDLLKGDLFQSLVVETNTITAKSGQLNLFSDEENVALDMKEDDDVITDHISLISILFIALLIMMIAALFILIIPKINHQEK